MFFFGFTIFLHCFDVAFPLNIFLYFSKKSFCFRYFSPQHNVSKKHIRQRKSQMWRRIGKFSDRYLKNLMVTFCSLWSLLLNRNLFWMLSFSRMSHFLKPRGYFLVKKHTFSCHFAVKLLRDSMKPVLSWPTWLMCPLEPNPSCLNKFLK